jgi:hypothetical protein
MDLVKIIITENTKVDEIKKFFGIDDTRIKESIYKVNERDLNKKKFKVSLYFELKYYIHFHYKEFNEITLRVANNGYLYRKENLQRIEKFLETQKSHYEETDRREKAAKMIGESRNIIKNQVTVYNPDFYNISFNHETNQKQVSLTLYLSNEEQLIRVMNFVHSDPEMGLERMLRKMKEIT